MAVHRHLEQETHVERRYNGLNRGAREALAGNKGVMYAQGERGAGEGSGPGVREGEVRQPASVVCTRSPG